MNPILRSEISSSSLIAAEDKFYIQEALQKGWYLPYFSSFQNSEEQCLWKLIEIVGQNIRSHQVNSEPERLRFLNIFTVAIHPDLSSEIKKQSILKLLEGNLHPFFNNCRIHFVVFLHFSAFLTDDILLLIFQHLFQNHNNSYEEAFSKHALCMLEKFNGENKAELVEKLLSALPNERQDEALYYFFLNAPRSSLDVFFKLSPLFKNFFQTLQIEIKDFRRVLENDMVLRFKPYKRLYTIFNMIKSCDQDPGFFHGLARIHPEEWKMVISHLRSLSCNISQTLIGWLKSCFKFYSQRLTHTEEVALWMGVIEKILDCLEKEQGIFVLADEDYRFFIHSMDVEGVNAHFRARLPVYYWKNFMGHLLQENPEKMMAWYNQAILQESSENKIAQMMLCQEKLSFISAPLQKLFFDTYRREALINLHYFLMCEKEEKKAILRKLVQQESGLNVLRQWIEFSLPSSKALDEDLKQLFIVDFGYLCFQLEICARDLWQGLVREDSQDSEFLETYLFNTSSFISDEALEIFGLKLLNRNYAKSDLNFAARHDFTKKVLSLYLKKDERQVLIEKLFAKLPRRSRSLIAVHILNENDFTKDVQSRYKNLELTIQCYIDLFKATKLPNANQLLKGLNCWVKDNGMSLTMVNQLLKLKKSYRYFFELLENLPLKEPRLVEVVSLMLDSDNKIHYLKKALYHAKKISSYYLKYLLKEKSEYLQLIKEAKILHSAQGLYYFFDQGNPKEGFRLIECLIEKDRNSARDFLEMHFANWSHEISLLNEVPQKKMELFHYLCSLLIKVNSDVFNKIDQLSPNSRKRYQAWYKNKEMTSKLPTMEDAFVEMIGHFDPEKLEDHLLEHFKIRFTRRFSLMTFMEYLQIYKDTMSSLDPLLSLINQEEKIKRAFLQRFSRDFFTHASCYPEIILSTVRFFAKDAKTWLKKRVRMEMEEKNWDGKERYKPFDRKGIVSLFLLTQKSQDLKGLFQELLNEVDARQGSLLREILNLN